VRAVDALGNADGTPASFTWAIDTTAPPAPVVITPANGANTNNAQPSVSGFAEVNSTVTVFIDGTAAGTTTTDAAGNWTFTPPTPLSDGPHTVRARATDAAGNTSPDSNTNTFTVDASGPDTTITSSPANPSNIATASFTFTGDDGSGPGVGIASFECALDGGSFSVCTSPRNYTGLGDVSHTFQVRALDTAGNVDPTPASFTWTVDTKAIAIISSGITGQPGNDVIVNGRSYTNHFNQLKVSFSEDADDPAGDVGTDDVTNPANYLLIQSGPNAAYDTVSCAGGLAGDDVQIPTGPVAYANNGGSGPFIATVTVNNSMPLPLGKYHLLVCGTTSIVDLLGNPLNGGADSVASFSIVDAPTGSRSTGNVFMPETGFAPGVVTTLPAQTEAYATLSDLKLEIPSQNVSATIVGVPSTAEGWDVSWLGQDVGYLDGTAFPTWDGNSVITGHVFGSNGLAGPFMNLNKMAWGQRIIVHLDGQRYIYEVRTVKNWVTPNDTSSITKHEEISWLTLITCRSYDEKTDSYRYRTVVRAVLVKVEADK
jgi:LPXTG-site transpeptidase (sortase) family protein